MNFNKKIMNDKRKKIGIGIVAFSVMIAEGFFCGIYASSERVGTQADPATETVNGQQNTEEVKSKSRTWSAYGLSGKEAQSLGWPAKINALCSLEGKFTLREFRRYDENMKRISYRPYAEQALKAIYAFATGGQRSKKVDGKYYKDILFSPSITVNETSIGAEKMNFERFAEILETPILVLDIYEGNCLGRLSKGVVPGGFKDFFQKLSIYEPQQPVSTFSVESDSFWKDDNIQSLLVTEGQKEEKKELPFGAKQWQKKWRSGNLLFFVRPGKDTLFLVIPTQYSIYHFEEGISRRKLAAIGVGVTLGIGILYYLYVNHSLATPEALASTQNLETDYCKKRDDSCKLLFSSERAVKLEGAGQTVGRGIKNSCKLFVPSWFLLPSVRNAAQRWREKK
jgi:hypothetical protein